MMKKKCPTFQIYKASSLNKRCNVYMHVLAREYDAKYSQNRIHHITGTLITKGNCRLKKVWNQTSPQRICCDGRFAFLNNYEECIDCGQYPIQGKLTPRFKLKREKHEKILDGLLMDGVSESVSLPHKGHRSSLLAVTKNGLLLRVDLETGNVLEKVSVVSPGIRFQKVHWNQIDESFVISSVLYPRQPLHFMRQAGIEIIDVIQLIVMNCMPLDFVCKLSVTRQVFGRHVEDASISLDLLMVMHSTSHIRMYNFHDLLHLNKTHSHRLYDAMPDGSTFGSDSCPLSHNVQITECPPCLLEVRCRNRDVMITMPPCHYVMWPVEKSPGYCCYSVHTKKMVKNGCLEAEENSLEEKVGLHADDSGRIIQVNNSHLKMFKLVPVEGSEDRTLVEDFKIDCSAPPQTQSETVTVSLSGRIIKKRFPQGSSDIPDQIVLSLMYSEDLDMIIVLSLQSESSSLSDECTRHTVVGFYNNWNGKLLQQFQLDDAPTDEVEERYFGYDDDTVTHVFKNLKKKMECHVYKFEMGTLEAISDNSKVKPAKTRQQAVLHRSKSRSRR